MATEEYTESVREGAHQPGACPATFGPAKISFTNVSKSYASRGAAGGHTLALQSLDLDIREGEIVSIVGPTGCGKSTALNLIAGFETPSTGSVTVDRQHVGEPDPNRAVVFQQSSLFPWMTVIDNVTLGVKCRGARRSEYQPRADQLLAAVGLNGFERHYSYQLSGGMQQRVQLARALIGEPQVLLMDEPFGALDYQTRLLMQKLLLSLWERFRPTILFITHDVPEAVFISDRVVVMTRRPGRVKLVVEVSAPKPRSYEFLSSQEFVQIEQQVLAAVQREVEDPAMTAAGDQAHSIAGGGIG